MNARPFYVLTCALALVAIVVLCSSVMWAWRAEDWDTKAAEADSPSERVACHSTALWHVSKSDSLYLSGALLFLAALGVCVTSRFREEHASLKIPLLLMTVAQLLQLLLL